MAGAAEVPLAAEIAAGRRRRRAAFLRRLFGHGSFLIGFAIMALFVATALAAPLIAPHSPIASDYRNLNAPPSALHWLGTDAFGRDVLSRIIYGMRVSLRIGIAVVLVTGLFGTVLGVLASYVRWLDGLVMRALDGLMAFPGVLLAIALAAVLGPSEANAVAGAVDHLHPAHRPGGARGRAGGAGHALCRGRPGDRRRAWPDHPALHTRQRPVAADRAADLCLRRLGGRRGDPQLPSASARPRRPRPWATSSPKGRSSVQETWWLVTFPGMVIAVAVLGLNLMGDGLRDVLDPRQIARREGN
ncbi:MAG: hypothetical protein KatS3mg118_0745 [Paracoccaceae bacterium]|nr:MAG: hypothetical protein KatS3mg118_0745 [Paracoccaceae bacterium]